MITNYTNLGSLSQIRLNEYQLKNISFNYNIWKIFNNTRQRKYGLTLYNLHLKKDSNQQCREVFCDNHYDTLIIFFTV
jgi:hypothetical protein